jgi:hypothetical protein
MFGVPGRNIPKVLTAGYLGLIRQHRVSSSCVKDWSMKKTLVPQGYMQLAVCAVYGCSTHTLH